MLIPPMKTSENGRKFIELWEGTILDAYDDANDRVVQPGQHVYGTLTIGVGHTTAAGPPKVYVGMKIMPEESDAILTSDLASVEADVNHHVMAKITQDQFDALVSFDYNTGALDRSNVLRAVNAGLPAESVAADLNMWSNAGGRPNSGLLRRRHAEFLLYSTGKVVGP